MNIKYLKGALASLILCISSLANAGLIMLDPSDEGRFRNIHSSYSQDSSKEVYCNASCSWETRIVLEYDVLSLSGDINSASINASTPNSILNGTIIDLYAYAGNGTLEIADVFAGVLVGSYDPALTNSITLDISVLQNLLDNGATYFGFANRVRTGSMQAYWIPDHKLTIDYDAKSVPEPSTLAIFALGMIGLASRRFKKQS